MAAQHCEALPQGCNFIYGGLGGRDARQEIEGMTAATETSLVSAVSRRLKGIEGYYLWAAADLNPRMLAFAGNWPPPPPHTCASSPCSLRYARWTSAVGYVPNPLFPEPVNFCISQPD